MSDCNTPYVHQVEKKKKYNGQINITRYLYPIYCFTKFHHKPLKNTIKSQFLSSSAPFPP